MHGAFRGIYTLRLFVFIGVLLFLAGCSYRAAVSKLSPQEQTEFRAHSKVMSPGQVRTYLAKPTPGARTAYLEEIGSTQRFAALDPEDRKSVLAGYIRVGMSTEALRYLWGQPYYIKGYKGHYEYWYYFGSSADLADSITFANDIGTMVEVYLVDGRIKWWLETSPSGIEDGDDSTGRIN